MVSCISQKLDQIYCKFTLFGILLKQSTSHPEVLCKKGILKNFTKFTGKHLCQSLFLNKIVGQSPVCNPIKKKTMTQVFSCEFCEIFKNTFFKENLWITASVLQFLMRTTLPELKVVSKNTFFKEHLWLLLLARNLTFSTKAEIDTSHSVYQDIQ